MGFVVIVVIVKFMLIEDLKLIVYFWSFRLLWYFVLKLFILVNVKSVVWKCYYCVWWKDVLMFGLKINENNCNKYCFGLISLE